MGNTLSIVFEVEFQIGLEPDENGNDKACIETRKVILYARKDKKIPLGMEELKRIARVEVTKDYTINPESLSFVEIVEGRIPCEYAFEFPGEKYL